MTIPGNYPQGRSQVFTFSRRGLLQGLALAILPFLVRRSQPVFEIIQKYPLPRFTIGNQIHSFWIDEYGEVDESFPPEVGEIMGICWHPKNEQWEYIINWTGGDHANSMYPIFDEALIDECSLRLVRHI